MVNINLFMKLIFNSKGDFLSFYIATVYRVTLLLEKHYHLDLFYYFLIADVFHQVIKYYFRVLLS